MSFYVFVLDSTRYLSVAITGGCNVRYSERPLKDHCKNVLNDSEQVELSDYLQWYALLYIYSGVLKVFAQVSAQGH